MLVGEEVRDLLELHRLLDEYDHEPVCRQDPDLFHPEKFNGTANHGDVNTAKKVCNACPIRRECAAFGMKWDEYGIYGGLTPSDRRTLRSRIRVKALAR